MESTVMDEALDRMQENEESVKERKKERKREKGKTKKRRRWAEKGGLSLSPVKRQIKYADQIED